MKSETFVVQTDAGESVTFEVEEMAATTYLTPRFRWRIAGHQPTGKVPGPWSRVYSTQQAARGGAVRTLKLAPKRTLSSLTSVKP